jgi:hypothetical protein
MVIRDSDDPYFSTRDRCTLCNSLMRPPIILWEGHFTSGPDDEWESRYLYFCSDCSVNLRRALTPDLNEVYNTVQLRRMGFANAMPERGSVIVGTSDERH